MKEPIAWPTCLYCDRPADRTCGGVCIRHYQGPDEQWGLYGPLEVHGETRFTVTLRDYDDVVVSVYGGQRDRVVATVGEALRNRGVSRRYEAALRKIVEDEKYHGDTLINQVRRIKRYARRALHGDVA